MIVFPILIQWQIFSIQDAHLVFFISNIHSNSASDIWMPVQKNVLIWLTLHINLKSHEFSSS